MTPEEKQMRRQRALSMANHPSRRKSFDKWEKQFQEMEEDDQALKAANSNNYININNTTNGHS